MIGPRKPSVEISIGGSPAGLFIGNTLKQFSYSDVHHGEVDEINFTLADGSGLWRGSWGIDEGTEVTAMIGYSGLLGAKVSCGTYAVDEVEAVGDSSGDTAVFKALAAFTSKELRTERSEAYDQIALKTIIDRVAGRHNLKVVGEIPDLKFERISQNKESDLAFATRLAEDWGCYFSVKGNQLVFTTRASIEGAAAVRLFNLTKGDKSIRYSLRKSTHNLYKKAEAKYLNPKSNQVLTAKREDPRVLSGDTLKIDDRAETQAHAETQCEAQLARANDDLGTGKLTLTGDPLLVAGQVIELGATFGRYAGRWLVTAAEHHFSTAGYTTSLDLKVL